MKCFYPNPADAELFSRIYFRIPPGGGPVTIDAAEWVAFGNLAGALNWATAPDTTPIPTDPEATFMARAAVGQNCAWGNLLTPAEQNWAVGKWGAEASLRIQAYAGGGSGGANVQERRNPDGTYSFIKFEGGPDGVWYPDVKVTQLDGSQVSAADLWCAEKKKPNTLPRPLP